MVIIWFHAKFPPPFATTDKYSGLIEEVGWYLEIIFYERKFKVS